VAVAPLYRPPDLRCLQDGKVLKNKLLHEMRYAYWTIALRSGLYSYQSIQGRIMPTRCNLGPNPAYAIVLISEIEV
jgi:hypothetical protein